MRRLILFCLLLVLLVVRPAPAQADGPASHVVAWGETLYSISRLFGVSPQSLAAANGLTLGSWVYAGERLVIPGRGAAARPASAPQTTPSGIYTVRAGDTLTGVASQFAVSVDALAAANNMPANGVLYTGWQLKIPSAGATSAAENGLVAIPSPAPSASGAARTAVTYIVQPGDTLFRIALNYDTTTQAVAQANSLPSFFVYSGQRLTIPGARLTASAPASPAPAARTALNLRVAGVPLYRQQQTLTCEEAAAAMALRGALGEAQIVNAMPRSDNPFDGIRGGTNYPLYGGLDNYGTYAQGLQKGLAALGRASTVLYGQAFPDFKNAVLANLRAGAPVIWWTTWRQIYEAPVWVKTSGGDRVPLVPYEHTVVLVAASDAGVTYDDPYDATVRFTSWATFQRVSAYFGNMALVVQ